MHITICTCRHAQGHVKSFVTRRNVHLFYWLVCTVQQCKQKKIHASKYQSIKWLIPQCSYWFHNDWFHNVHTDSTMFILIPQCSYWFLECSDINNIPTVPYLQHYMNQCYNERFPNTTLPLPFLIIKTTTTTTKQTNTKTISNTAETFNWNIQTIKTSTHQQNTSYPHNKIR